MNCRNRVRLYLLWDVFATSLRILGFERKEDKLICRFLGVWGIC
jgi:hypothetical protein